MSYLPFSSPHPNTNQSSWAVTCKHRDWCTGICWMISGFFALLPVKKVVSGRKTRKPEIHCESRSCTRAIIIIVVVEKRRTKLRKVAW